MLQALADAVYSALGWVRRRPFLAFLCATFGFSWADWISLAASGARVVPGNLPTDMAGMAVPAIAALVVTAVSGGEPGLKDLALRVVRFPWRSPWLWLLAPSPLWVLLGVQGVRAALGATVPAAAEFARYPGVPNLPLLAVFDLVLLGVGFGQEIGWRGLALPRLQARFGPLAGALSVALPWGAWLLPSLLLDGPAVTPGRGFAAALPGAGLLLLASSVMLAFVVARTGGSLATAAVWHACLRMATATDGARGPVGEAVTGVVVAGALAVVLAELRARRRGETLLLPPAETVPPA